MSADRQAGGGLRTFQDAVAVITGGGSGIGAALARTLAARGARVVLADRDGAAARAEADRIGHLAEAAEVDVRDAAQVDRLIDETFVRHGRLDYLFNNAGIAVGGEVRDLLLDDWRYIVEVNLMGVVHGVQAAYPRMLRHGFGHIVNTASLAGLMATPYTTPYGATKHAVVGLSRSLRLEAAPLGVRVSVLCPGVIRTSILINGGRFGRTTVPLREEVQRRLWEQFRPMDPDAFARQTLDQVARNRAIIIVPWYWRLAWWMNRLAPSLADAWMGRRLARLKATLEEVARREDVQ